MQHSLTSSPKPASSRKPRKRRGKVSKEDVTEGLLTALEVIFGDDISKYLSDGSRRASGALIDRSESLVFGDARMALRWNAMSPRERAEWIVRHARPFAA